MKSIRAEVTNWRKASYSSSGGNCVEVGASTTHIGVRDTKDRDGGMLTVSPAAWGSFLDSIKAGEFDLH
ncbi:DUF397 domain-containing protein [Actinopolymorpha pittospori]|uniref:DUF397 domain-containing protein n=1 Tax=Actinopolymorpha pittospori TaxID=648752 RepID=A0A927N530_9ACTN|nr:hypothetical protein [Actinopolymorpha pittospori]